MPKEGAGGVIAASWSAGRVILGVALAGSVLSWFESWWWIGELAACLRPAFAAVLGAAALIAWWREWTGWALICGVLFLTSPLQVLPGNRELDRAVDGEQGPPVTVYCHNLHGANRQISEVLREVRELAPDIVVLIEVNSWWLNQLQELEKTHPHHLAEARPGEGLRGAFGIAVYSRKPFRDSVIRDFSGYELPSLRVRFFVGGQVVTLIGTHPPPPVNALSFRIRNWHLAELAREARLQEGPLIVVGDLNCTPWSAACRRFVRESGLRKTGVSREITWSPVRRAWLGFPIDYQLASQEWKVARWKTGNFLGSDHRWTLVEYRLASHRRP